MLAWNAVLCVPWRLSSLAIATFYNKASMAASAGSPLETTAIGTKFSYAYFKNKPFV